jgi:FkbM family methyltransferase
MAVRALFGERLDGTYVDIGAHHPVYYSNTCHFYRKGWRGLNVDALPGAMDAFRILRPEDINIEACIVPTLGQTLTLHIFEDAALCTVDAALAAERQRHGKRLLATRDVPCMTLTECLNRYLPARHIDLLSIDVEGMDEAILYSHDWSHSAPSVLVFERHGLALGGVEHDAVIRFLTGRGYVLEGKCGPSFIMRHESFSAD